MHEELELTTPGSTTQEAVAAFATLPTAAANAADSVNESSQAPALDQSHLLPADFPGSSAEGANRCWQLSQQRARLLTSFFSHSSFRQRHQWRDP